MMVKRFLKLSLWAAMGLLVVGCAAKQPRPALEAFQPHDLTAGPETYVAGVSNFMIILDASQSMGAPSSYAGHSNFTFAKELIKRMNATLPDFNYNGALRTFGHGECLPQEKTLLIKELQPYDKERLASGLESVACDGGPSPLAPAIDAASADLAETDGNIAIIIISDGKEMGRKDVERIPLPAVEAMKGKFGERLCVYTIQVGDDPQGQKLLEDMAEAGECGFAVNAEDIATSSGMAGFVEKVFLTEAMDSDGDGVPDHMDQCPDTPRGVKVDANGCPIDSDGDGVPDYLDQCADTPQGLAVDDRGCSLDSDGDGVPDNLDKCPGTPPGVIVDDNGCELYKGIMFDFDKANVKSQYYPMLDELAEMMLENPELEMTIEGHTDNIGTEAYNMTLSERRARSVMEYLVNKGVPADRISTEAFGFSKPIASNDTPEGRARNRRAEVKME